MNISILYPLDKIGKKLCERLQEEWEEVYCDESMVRGEKYLDIRIKDKNSDIIRILNSAGVINNCINRDLVSSILNMNRISYDNLANELINRYYEIAIFDLQTVYIRTRINKAGQKFKYIKESENSKIVEVAKKVVHLLGLDFACITIALTAKRKIKVMKINSAPVLRERDINSIVKRIHKIFLYEDKDIKLGADPEFMMINTKTGKMVSASQFFPREGIIGCDNIRVPNRQQRPVAEVRPRPDTSPMELMTNIKKALGTASRMAPYRNVKWVAGSQPIPGYSIGGHIHFSNIELNAALLRALDNYIGIPVFLIENQETAIKRRRKYGYIGDYRLKDYGGFEYRTPGSWLVSQEIATAVICLAKIVASCYPSLSRNYLNNVAAQKAFYSGNQAYFRPSFLSIWADIQNTDLYDLYAEELQVLYTMIMDGTCWDEKMDFRKTWKITSGAKRNYGQKKTSTNATVQSRPTTRNTPRRISSRSTRSTRVRSSSNRAVSRDRRAPNPTSGRITGSGRVRTTVTIRQ
ncbi:MAG: hypothetical protein PHT79_08800 [Syntrophomonadaceae bacterium]|nr:hypothetical protein [Syntrophomonadaceae bacterium]MDD3889687.1 hypothetical protein [Syntrophomonadaceae bacterium]MDD4549838.1 hypothetical protein [Syntrophomonadaceae bacterium]